MKIRIAITISIFLVLGTLPVQAETDSAVGELFGLRMQIIAPFPDVFDDGVAIDTVRSGTYIQITIGYHNLTQANYEDFTIISYFPNRLESYTKLVRWNHTPPTGVDPDSTREATWELGTLYPNQKDSLTFTLYVNTAPLDTIYFSYQTVAYASRTPVTQVAQTHIYVPGGAGASPYPGLHIDKNADRLNVYPGDTLTYSIHYGNTSEPGSLPALYPVILDTLPSGFTLLDGDLPTSTKSLPDGRNLLTWDLPANLPRDTHKSLQYRVRVDLSPDRMVEKTNLAHIISQTNENNFVDNYDRETVRVRPKIDLAIHPLVGPTVHLETNDRQIFPIRCSNLSSLALGPVNVSVTLTTSSPLLTGYLLSDFGNGRIGPDHSSIHWQISHLPAQSDTTITFALALTGTERYENFSLRFQAEIDTHVVLADGIYPDINPADNQIQWLVHIDTTPDLAVEIMADQDTVRTDAICAVKVICTNLSAPTQMPSWVRIYLNEQTAGAAIYRLADFSASAVAVNPDQSLIQWQIPPLARSDSSTLSFNLVFDQITEYCDYRLDLHATVDSIETNAFELMNNSDAIAIQVDATPDFTIRILSQDGQTSAEPGTSLAFTLKCQNLSARALKNTRVQAWIDDQLPGSNLYTMIAESGIAADSAGLRWEIAPLAYQAETELSFRLNFDKIYSIGAYQVQITAAIDSVELNPDEQSNNVAQLSIRIQAAPQLSLGPITQEHANPGLKSSLSYRIPITNTGNFPAQNLMLHLEMPTCTFLYSHRFENDRVDYPDSSQKNIQIRMNELQPQEQKEVQIQARVFSYQELPGSESSPLRLELKATLNYEGDPIQANHVTEITFDGTRSSLYLDRNIVETGHFPLGISVTGSESGPLAVQVFNLAGEFIKTIYKGPIEKGAGYRYYWSGDNEQGQGVASGVYFIHAAAPSFQDFKKVVIVR